MHGYREETELTSLWERKTSQIGFSGQIVSKKFNSLK
jgi:hypothetical protein